MKRAHTLFGLTAALFIGVAAQAQERVWIQVEAKPNLTEGTDRARAWSTAFGDVSGYRLSSGWYGIVLGPYSPAQAAEKLADLKRQGMIPRDSYLTDGRPFRASFWSPAPAAETAGGAAVPEAGAGAGTAPAPDAGGEVAASAAPVPPANLHTNPTANPTANPTGSPDAAAADPAPQTFTLDPAANAGAALPATDPAASLAAVPAPVLSGETAAEARDAEALLSADERAEIQTALKWFGFYDAVVDGAFGRGTRASMAAWQTANGFDPTGILTSAQRSRLLGAHDAERRAFGFQTLTEGEAGIEIALPTALVAFDHYEPPFVHYLPKAGSGYRVILISAPGDAAALTGLYEAVQQLSILPRTGPRQIGEDGFTVQGQDAGTQAYAQASLSRGMIKGFILSGPATDPDRMARVLSVMTASFRAVGDRALDPGLVPMDPAARAGLLAGLDVAQPERSRSGLFVDAKGSVLTTIEAVAQCGRITVEREVPARLALDDAATGLAVLVPEKPLAPPAFATFQTRPDRAGIEVSVSGYSYEGRLPAPTLTFGTLSEAQGLEGEPGLKRLTAPVLAGDAGGPVLDPTGAVIGVLLPRDATGPRVLPEGVSFAAAVPQVTALLARAGIPAATALRDTPATPDGLAQEAAGMTTLVSCWK